MKLFWGYHLFCFYYNTFTGVIIKGTLHLGVQYHTPLGVGYHIFPVDGTCQNWPFFSCSYSSQLQGCENCIFFVLIRRLLLPFDSNDIT